MATEWITKAANKYTQDLREKRIEDSRRQRQKEIEQARLQRIATEGPEVGTNLWTWLQSVMKLEVGEFNEAVGDTVMRTEARGDGTFKVCLGEPGGIEKIASLSYASESTTLSWQVFGGPKGIPLTVGLKPNHDNMQVSTGDLQFTNGTSYYSVKEISREVISSLLS
jgi:hypothetical protein